MHFLPTAKPKRFAQLHQQTTPFPLPSPNSKKARAIFTGFTVEVLDKIEMAQIYDNGFFGKGSHSRSVPGNVHEQETLVLSLEEAFFLSHFLKFLEIEDLGGKILTSEDVFKEFVVIKPSFVHSMVAYLYLKSKNWVVKSGAKFGGEFLIYKKGPRFYHASFVVAVSTNEQRQTKDVKGLQRVGETSDKDVLYLTVNPPRFLLDTPLSEHLNYMEEYTVTESVVKRFNFSSFVQSSQSQK